MGQVGFGCAGLTSLNDTNAAIELLETAFENGITHYDVARLYGMGAAERIVGDFAKNKRDKITITTKLGLNPPAYMPVNSGIAVRIKKLIKHLPGVQKLAKRALHASVKPDFSITNAEKSLHTSLKELQTDRIDYLLLHEATVADANNEELIRFLDDACQQGKIGRYGVGTAFDKLDNDCALFPKKFYVFQFDSDPLNENIGHLKHSASKLLITHSVLRNMDALFSGITATTSDELRSLAGNIHADIFNTADRAAVVLYYCACINNNGITLFSSTKKSNIKKNLQLFKQLSAAGVELPVKNLIDYIKQGGKRHE